MITFLFGSYGSGKTTEILHRIASDTEKGIHTFLLVPEQATVQSEHAALQSLPLNAQLILEVLNFSRLYNRVCREYGGICYRYVTPAVRQILMWQNLRELAPFLQEFGSIAEKDSALPDRLLATLNECKSCGISPEQLEQTAKKLNKNEPLAKRLQDLALIFSSFERLVSQNYSDSSDDLMRLYEVLCQKKFFANTHVYLDSFTSFTAMEHRIIERIFAQAEDVTVSIPLPNPECKDISVAGIRQSMQKLLSSAELHGGYQTVIFSENRRTESLTLDYLSKNLWRMDVSDGNGTAQNDGSIHMEICDTPYAEAEAVASHVLELLRAGERCRDITVLMRNPEQYKGIIDLAFEKNDIPFFFSEKTDLCTLPPVQLLLSALRIKQYHWKREDIISHIKTGMYGFSERSCDLFEEYISTWNINGTRFTDCDWTMNPDGFTDRMTERGQNILNAANEIRRQLTKCLEDFFILLDASENISDLCRAVYRYFSVIELDKRLEHLAQKEWSVGHLKEASELQAVYGIVLNTLADIAVAMPEEAVTVEEFALILKTAFSKTEVGSIPTSIDEVTVGSAAMLRTSNPKYVFILGLCEGEFPAANHETGLFSNIDRTILADLGVELNSNAEISASDELMYVHRAFSSPSHGLYLLTSVAELTGKMRNPSLPFNRVRAMFPNITPHRFIGSDLRYVTGAPKSAISHLRVLKGSADGNALQAALHFYFPQIDTVCERTVSNTHCQISSEVAGNIFGKKMHFSSSRFETYIECPLNYYCTYVLGLREKKQAEFRASDMGSFIHYILEQLLRFAVTESENGEFPNDEALIQRTEEKVEEYIQNICPSEYQNSKRLRHLYLRLKRLSLLMVRNIVKEFSHSQFQPAFFELETNGKDSNPTPMEFILEDGSCVSFSGIIDRVDLFKKDDQIYIRIVDYKTGSKSFSLEDAEHGINIQLLLYLFTLCRNTDSAFGHSIGLKEGQTPIPAGIVYLSANIPVIQIETYNNDEEVLAQASKAFKRSGLLLNDETILSAMNSEFSPDFLAGIKKNKDGLLVGRALTDRTSFQQIYQQIEAVIKTILTELRGGNANASPLSGTSNDPCSYCKMKPICRKTES